MKKVNKEKALQLVSKGAMLVDLRSPIAYRNGTVTGSVNLPLKNFTNKILGLNRKQKFVIFSDKIDDSDLKTAVNYAEQLGFTELYISEYQQFVETT